MNKAADFRWVGIDTPGDITEPTAEFAVWFAHQRHSMTIEISDFLSALVLLSERELCKRWVSPQACVSFMWHAELSMASRDAIAQEACSWLFSGMFHLPGTGISGQVRGSGRKRPVIGHMLETFLESVRDTARRHNLRWPTIDCILITLLDHPEFGEQETIRSSGIDEQTIRRTLGTPMEG